MTKWKLRHGGIQKTVSNPARLAQLKELGYQVVETITDEPAPAPEAKSVKKAAKKAAKKTAKKTEKPKEVEPEPEAAEEAEPEKDKG